MFEHADAGAACESTELPMSRGRRQAGAQGLDRERTKQTGRILYLRCPRYPWLWDCGLWWCSQWWCWQWDYSRETPAGLLVSPEEHTQTNTMEDESRGVISRFIREYQTLHYSLSSCVILYHCHLCPNLLHQTQTVQWHDWLSRARRSP